MGQACGSGVWPTLQVSVLDASEGAELKLKAKHRRVHRILICATYHRGAVVRSFRDDPTSSGKPDRVNGGVIA